MENRIRREEVSCCICRSGASRLEGTGWDFEYKTSNDVYSAYRCAGCDVVFLNPRPHPSEFSRIYPASYHALDFSAEGYGLVHRVRSQLEGRRLLKYCEGIPDDARVLDVGCGDGFHLALLGRYGPAGWVVEGMDVDRRAVEAAERRGLTARVGSIEEPGLEEGKYDLVYSIQTIEHLGRPDLAFQNVFRALKPGGRFVVVTDNTDTLDFKLFKGRYWGGYHFPRHWHLFNKRSLAELASRTGFTTSSIRTIVSPVNWVYSIHNSLVDKAAPSWLVALFTLRSPPSLAAFTVLDMALSRMGRGALLNAAFYKPNGGPAN